MAVKHGAEGQAIQKQAREEGHMPIRYLIEPQVTEEESFREKGSESEWFQDGF